LSLFSKGKINFFNANFFLKRIIIWFYNFFI
jgi:hypothetical protein